MIEGKQPAGQTITLVCIGCGATFTIPLTDPRDADVRDGICKRCYDGFVLWLRCMH